jgi:hypothetical protein
MSKIEFRYRDYKDKNLRGTYLCENGRQLQRVSARRLTIAEMNQLRKQMILTESGYVEKGRNFEKQIADDQIKQVNEDSLNIVISDIYKQNGKWEKESTKDRDYLAKDDDINELKKVV